MTFSYTFNPEKNSREVLVFTATIDPTSDICCPYYTSTIELNSYAANTVFNLPMVITPEKLRDCANKLESFLSQNSVKSISCEEKIELSNDFNTPIETLVQLASDVNKDVRYEVAYNPNTPPETLVQLASDENCYVRCGVAKNLNTPPETLVQLASDENRYVRYWVAKNPNTPPETLEHLASDEHWGVRYWVARNPNTPPETLVQLASDEHWYVRCRVAKNPNYQKSIKLSVKEVDTLKSLLDSTQSEELKSIASKL